MLDSCSEVSNINKETINTTSSLYAHKLWRLKIIKNLQKTGTLQEARTLNVQIAQMTNFCFPKTWSHCHQKLWMKIENFKIHHKGNTHPVGFFIKIWVIFLKFIPPMWCFFIWVFPKTGVPQNGWFIIRENLIRNDDLRVPLFLETPIFCKNPTDPRRKNFVPPLCTAAAAKRLGPS